MISVYLLCKIIQYCADTEYISLVSLHKDLACLLARNRDKMKHINNKLYRTDIPTFPPLSQQSIFFNFQTDVPTRGTYCVFPLLFSTQDNESSQQYCWNEKNLLLSIVLTNKQVTSCSPRMDRGKSVFPLKVGAQ